jgi:hypothetical protein
MLHGGLQRRFRLVGLGLIDVELLRQFPRRVIVGLLFEESAERYVVEVLGSAEEEGVLDRGGWDFVGLQSDVLASMRISSKTTGQSQPIGIKYLQRPCPIK